MLSLADGESSYGTKGSVIIQSTIMRMFNPNQMRCFTAPLSATQFTAYILAPHVACKLIEEDLCCTTREAFLAMLESSDVGVSLYPADDDDDELDLAIRSNMRGAKTRFSDDAIDAPPGYQLVVVARPSDSMIPNATAEPSRPKPRQVKLVPLPDANQVLFSL